MEGSRLPIAVAHGEGRAEFADDAGARGARTRAASSRARFVDTTARSPSAIPKTPTARPAASPALTTPDGRVTILMPHPERVFRTVQYSWRPRDWARRRALDAHVPQRARLGRGALNIPLTRLVEPAASRHAPSRAMTDRPLMQRPSRFALLGSLILRSGCSRCRTVGGGANARASSTRARRARRKSRNSS